MPIESESSAPRICLGNTNRLKDAGTVKVQVGETSSGADIVIPLSRLHHVSGSVTALADGHPMIHGTVDLLFPDDREMAREVSISQDGSFFFSYLPEGKYILRITDARDVEKNDANPESSATILSDRHYATKEIPLPVLEDDVDDFRIQLELTPPAKPQEQ